MIEKCCAIIMITRILMVLGQQCVTPNNKPGACIPVSSCQPILNAFLQGNLQDDTRKFIRSSYCGFGNNGPLVCCGSDATWTNSRTTTLARIPTAQEPSLVVERSWSLSNLLPKEPNCGSSLNNRIIGGHATEIDEFPWMALLQYKTATGQLIFSCGGSLINNKYVLTAAHCVTGAINRVVGPLVSVRLGEYDTRFDVDCKSDNGENDCADPVQDIFIDTFIAHPDYRDNTQNNANDIALVRLAREATFNDFVKPICLPEPSTPDVSVGDKFSVAGWGQTLTAKRSDVKMKVEVPFISEDNCKNFFKSFSVQLGNGQLCAGGLSKQDSCQGDSGGPLMKNLKGHWYSEGVVSFGIGCGETGNPGVYTKIRTYMNWIVENVRF